MAHGSLGEMSPEMMLGLTQRVWSVLEYLRFPTHVSEFQRQLWVEQRNDVIESTLEKYQRKKSLPI